MLVDKAKPVLDALEPHAAFAVGASPSAAKPNKSAIEFIESFMEFSFGSPTMPPSCSFGKGHERSAGTMTPNVPPRAEFSVLWKSPYIMRL